MKIRFTLLLLLCAIVTGAGGYGAAHALVTAKSRPDIPKDLVSYRDVVKQVLPAVVSIEAKPRASANAHAVLGNIPPDLRKELEKRHQLPNPDESPGRALGSGFVVDASGVIFTNDHVVKDADEVEVHLQDGRTYTSRDIKRDPKTDLAIVRIQAKEALPVLTLGNADDMEVGDRVLAIGAPLGLTGSVTSGIISAKARDIHMNLYEDFIQTDAAINPGNSGGPLVNLAGEVIGINSAIKSGTGGFQGIGLAISSNLAKNVMEQLLKDGVVHRGYLGVQTQQLDPAVAGRLGLEGKGGVVIAKVMPGSPAAKAGLQDGDILTGMAGHSVKDPRELQRVVAGLKVDQKVEVSVFRDGAAKTLEVTVTEQPKDMSRASSDEPSSADLGKIGVSVTELTPEKARQLGIPEKTEGVLITEVDPNSVAGGAGLRSGSVVLKVDQQRVKTVEEFQKAIEKGSLAEGMLLQVRTTQGGTTYVLLKSAASR
jgi:serine protease Do